MTGRLTLTEKVNSAVSQNLFITNVAASDLMVSVIGIFRGLGMIDTKFVGSPNNSTTPGCVIYSICLNTFT